MLWKTGSTGVYKSNEAKKRMGSDSPVYWRIQRTEHPRAVYSQYWSNEALRKLPAMVPPYPYDDDQ